MSDTTTLPPPAPTVGLEGGPTVRPRRSLPGGRAVVGAFLVILAAVGTFGAYLQATADPATSYLVATRSFTVGEVLTAEDVSGANPSFAFVAMDVPPEQAVGLYAEDRFQADAFVGAVVAAPVASGALFPTTALVAGDDGLGVSLAFSLPSDRALNGAIKRSERVDVIATFPSTGEVQTETRVVARDVLVVATAGAEEGIGGGRISLTVQVPDLATAQLLQHAVDVADVAIVRGGVADAATPTPDRSSAAPRSTTQDEPAAEPAPAAEPTAPTDADGGA